MVLYGRRDPAASDMRGVALTAGTRSTRITGSHPQPERIASENLNSRIKRFPGEYII